MELLVGAGRSWIGPWVHLAVCGHRGSKGRVATYGLLHGAAIRIPLAGCYYRKIPCFAHLAGRARALELVSVLVRGDGVAGECIESAGPRCTLSFRVELAENQETAGEASIGDGLQNQSQHQAK